MAAAQTAHAVLTLRQLTTRALVCEMGNWSDLALQRFVERLAKLPESVVLELFAELPARALAFCRLAGVTLVAGTNGALDRKVPAPEPRGAAECRRLASRVGLFENAIRREENAYRDARAAGRAADSIDSPLIDPFATDVYTKYLAHGCELDLPLPPSCVLFASMRARHFAAHEPGWRNALADAPDFKANWDEFTGGLLDGLDWTNLFAAGGSVVACAGRLPDGAKPAAYFDPTRGPGPKKRSFADSERSPFRFSSDIDLFIIGGDDGVAPTAEQAVDITEHVLETVEMNADASAAVIFSGSAVTFAVGFPRRHVQVVLKLFGSAADVLTSFDVDCCAFGYDGERLVCLPRALRALATRVNIVDTSRRSQTYESRLLKYARRQFGIGVMPELMRPDRLDEDSFDRHLLLPQEGRPLIDGLRRLCIADRAFSAAAAGSIKPGNEPQQTSLAFKRLGKLRNQLSVRTDALSGVVELTGNTSTVLHVHTSDQPQALYTTGPVPWEPNFPDDETILEYLRQTRGRLTAHHFEEAEGDDALDDAEPRVPNTAIPSGNTISWGSRRRRAEIRSDRFSVAQRCSSFFVRSADGFADGAHIADGVEQPTYSLDCPEAFLGRVARELARCGLLPPHLAEEVDAGSRGGGQTRASARGRRSVILPNLTEADAQRVRRLAADLERAAGEHALDPSALALRKRELLPPGSAAPLRDADGWMRVTPHAPRLRAGARAVLAGTGHAELDGCCALLENDAPAVGPDGAPSSQLPPSALVVVNGVLCRVRVPPASVIVAWS